MTTLSEMWKKYNLLYQFKVGMNRLGYVGKDLSVLDVQLELLRELIRVESESVLSELITKKTYYRRLKIINKGIEYLPDILNNPGQYILNKIDNDPEAWISNNVLIFECLNNIAVFSNISRKHEGATYRDNKWQ